MKALQIQVKVLGLEHPTTPVVQQFGDCLPWRCSSRAPSLRCANLVESCLFPIFPYCLSTMYSAMFWHNYRAPP